MTIESITKHLKNQNLTMNGENSVTLSNCEVSFRLSDSQVLYVVHKPAKANLLLAPESDYTRSADKIGVSEESKIGAGDFDDRYVIRDPDNKAEEVLNPEMRSAVEALEPFVELEFTRKRYRLLKAAGDEKQVENDLRNLERVVSLSAAE